MGTTMKNTSSSIGMPKINFQPVVKRGAVAPVITQNSDDVPDRKDDHYRNDRKGQAGGPTIDPGTQNELQRQRDQQAARHQQQVLEVIETAHFPTVQGQTGDFSE